MKKIIGIGVAIWFLYLVQTSIFIHFEFAGIVPNLMLLFVAIMGLVYGKKHGLIVGFLVGLLIDIFSFSILGIYALLYMLLGFVNGCFSKIFYPEDIKLPILLVLISEFSLNFVIYVLMFLLRGKLDLVYYILHVIVPEIVYTILIMLICYPVVLWIQKRRNYSKKEKFDNVDRIN